WCARYSSFSPQHAHTLLFLTLPCSLSLRRQPPIFTLFPYTTLFRSRSAGPPVPRPRRLRGAHRPLPRSRPARLRARRPDPRRRRDRKSTRLNSSHGSISYAVFCLKKKITKNTRANETSE